MQKRSSLWDMALMSGPSSNSDVISLHTGYDGSYCNDLTAHIPIRASDSDLMLLGQAGETRSIKSTY
jgi:hypothetical protein